MNGILEAFYFDMLLHPWALLLLAGVAALLVAEIGARAPGVIHLSTGASLAQLPASARQWMRRLPAVLRALGLALLVVALARPVQGMQPVTEDASVIDIMLCLDVSGSMRALDFSIGGERKNRLDVSQDVLRHFLDSRRELRQEGHIDRLGLILFAGYAWTVAPLTMDYDIVEREVDRAYIDLDDPQKQGTAIGTTIGLAVSRLRNSDADTKVVVLLTDGRNNTGELDPVTAAYLARDYGIRVYAIGAGSRGEVLIPQRTPFGGERLTPVNIPIDDAALEEITGITGGQYFRATDAESLMQAYDEISELERTEIEVTEYYHNREAFMPYAATGAIVLALALFGRRLWFDPVP